MVAPAIVAQKQVLVLCFTNFCIDMIIKSKVSHYMQHVRQFGCYCTYLLSCFKWQQVKIIAAALWPHVAHFQTWLLTTLTAPWRRKGWNRLTRGFLFSGSQFRHLYHSHWLSYCYRHSESHWLPETHFKQAGRDAEGREEKENHSFKGFE